VARAEIVGSSPVVWVIGDSATRRLDPLLPGPIWLAEARANPHVAANSRALALSPPSKHGGAEGGSAMGSEQQSAAVCTEYI